VDYPQGGTLAARGPECKGVVNSLSGSLLLKGKALINAEQQKRVDELCKMIAEEKDCVRVAELARELNQLLDAKALSTPPNE